MNWALNVMLFLSCTFLLIGGLWLIGGIRIEIDSENVTWKVGLPALLIGACGVLTHFLLITRAGH